MRYSIKVLLNLNFAMFSFLSISSAYRVDSSLNPSPIGVAAVSGEQATVEHGWWSRETDEILRKYQLRCKNFIAHGVEVTIYTCCNRQTCLDLANEMYLKGATTLTEKFLSDNQRIFSKPIEDMLKVVEPCFAVRYSDKPVAFQGEYRQANWGIPIDFITTNLNEFKPTIQFCQRMLLRADEQCIPYNLYSMFKMLGIDPKKKDKISTVDQIKKLYSLEGHEPQIIEQRRDKQELLDNLKCLTSHYKIHFMPHDKDLLNFIKILIDEIRKNSELRVALTSIKIMPIPELVHELDVKMHFGAINPSIQFPKVVLYCFGQEATQKALNILYGIFSRFPGIGRAPAYNVKVTDLIYFTHGDRRDKIMYPEWFDRASNMVYYSRAVIDDIAGQHISHDYTLINPAENLGDKI